MVEVKFEVVAIKCPNCGAEITDEDAFDYGYKAICHNDIYAKKDDGIPNVWYTVVKCYEEDCGELMFFPWVLDEPPEFWEVKYERKTKVEWGKDSNDGGTK